MTPGTEFLRGLVARRIADEIYTLPEAVLAKREDETWRDHAERLGQILADAAVPEPGGSDHG